MYCLYVGFDYTYIDINTMAQGIKSFLAHTFGLKPLIGLEPMAPIRLQFHSSHDNHLATDTFLKRIFSKPIIYKDIPNS